MLQVWGLPCSPVLLQRKSGRSCFAEFSHSWGFFCLCFASWHLSRTWLSGCFANKRHSELLALFVPSLPSSPSSWAGMEGTPGTGWGDVPEGKTRKIDAEWNGEIFFKKVFLLAVPQIIQVTASTISPGSQGFSPCREFLQISRAVVEFCFLLALQPNPRQDVRIAAEPSKKPQSFHTSDPAQNPAFFQDCRSESRRFLVQGFLESAFVAVIMNQG